jgi:hypothetical protein
VELADTPPNKGLKLTKPVNFEASQLNSSVRRLLTSPGSGQLRSASLMAMADPIAGLGGLALSVVGAVSQAWIDVSQRKRRSLLVTNRF